VGVQVLRALFKLFKKVGVHVLRVLSKITPTGGGPALVLGVAFSSHSSRAHLTPIQLSSLFRHVTQVRWCKISSINRRVVSGLLERYNIQAQWGRNPTVLFLSRPSSDLGLPPESESFGSNPKVKVLFNNFRYLQFESSGSNPQVKVPPTTSANMQSESHARPQSFALVL
jgi:hypothetical protein